MSDTITTLNTSWLPIYQPNESMSGSASDNGDAKKLKAACAELESLFIYNLLKEMRATVPKTGLLSGGKGEEMYTSMLDIHLAKELASGKGIGLSSILLNELGDGLGHNENKET